VCVIVSLFFSSRDQRLPRSKAGPHSSNEIADSSVYPLETKNYSVNSSAPIGIKEQLFFGVPFCLTGILKPRRDERGGLVDYWLFFALNSAVLSFGNVEEVDASARNRLIARVFPMALSFTFASRVGA